MHRLQQLFGNTAKRHLDRAAQRCPEAHFSAQDMCAFTVSEPVDLITCFLYSIHYSASIERLNACIAAVHSALAVGGVFCFNAVDKNKIDNNAFVAHTATHKDGEFAFSSAWSYPGEGERQALKLRIERVVAGEKQVWHDEHPMVAVSFAELQELLAPYFEVHVFGHDYQKLVEWDGVEGNGVFVCVKV